jgi:hypothetical protein
MTLLTLAAIAGNLAPSSHELPFALHAAGTVERVQPLPGVALPPGLQPGDTIELPEQTRVVRAVLDAGNVPPQTLYPLRLHRHGVALTVPFHSIPGPAPQGVAAAAGGAALLMVSLVAILTLWRGRFWSAWGLALFAIAVLVGSALLQTSAPPFGNLALIVSGELLTGPMAFWGLYLAVADLVGPRVGRRWWLAGYAGLLVVSWAVEIAGTVGQVVFASASSTALSIAGVTLALAMVIMPLVVLGLGYVGAAAGQRLRIRWILAGSALLVPVLVMSFVQSLDTRLPQALDLMLAVLRQALTAGIFAIYAFAVLSQRLVDVRIAINRALVFTVLMTLIVGSLGVTESLLERSALGTRTGFALEVAVPLALGAVFHHLQRRVEALVDRLFFRREHRAREALRDFVRDAGFIETPEVMADRMVAAFDRHAGGAGAALYEARGPGFECSAASGAAAWPKLLDPDDPALVRLRSTQGPVDLHAVTSALGSDGIALPLALRGRLFGALVCGPREAGRFSQGEIAELAQAAREAGASLFAVRAAANESLIERLAEGRVEPLQAAREARLLAGFG